jgi:SAM-dependent methyltransferase
MFTESAEIYDAIYAAFHDFDAEAEHVHALIRDRVQTGGLRLLDVACGTGLHWPTLSRHYTIEGVDLDPGMLAVAARKFPNVPVHQGDMTDFDLGRRFDAVICLGSSVGYLRTTDRLREAARRFARHLLPGGLLIVEPWFPPEMWEPGRLDLRCVDQPGLKICRVTISSQEGRISIMDFSYLIGTQAGVRHATERHELGLFTREEYLDAFRDAALEVEHDPIGLTGRGLYLGMRR